MAREGVKVEGHGRTERSRVSQWSGGLSKVQEMLQGRHLRQAAERQDVVAREWDI